MTITAIIALCLALVYCIYLLVKLETNYRVQLALYEASKKSKIARPIKHDVVTYRSIEASRDSAALKDRNY